MTSFSSGFIPLTDALAATEKVSEQEDYVSASGRLPASEVTKSKQHIRELYRGVNAVHSFLDEKGSVFDAVPYEMQPSVRDMENKNVPVAPDLSSSQDTPNKEQSEQRAGTNFRDEVGNQVYSPHGAVNMRRITLDIISKYGSLSEFLSKGASLAASDVASSDGLYHRYAVARQNIDNFGASAKFSIYKNVVDPTKKQATSLSQMWVASSSAVGGQSQTIEPAILTLPISYGSDPVIVMFYTSKGYQDSFKAYNTDDGKLTLTSNKWLLGSPIMPLSQIDGNQYYLHINVRLSDGLWWIYLGGDASENAIGYYSASNFQSVAAGGLGVKATRYDVGGEVAAQSIEPAIFPTMGSGQYANMGWKKSAYARDIKYYTTSGVATTGSVSVISQSPGYSAQRNRYAAPWNETLWHGGPGGT